MEKTLHNVSLKNFWPFQNNVKIKTWKKILEWKKIKRFWNEPDNKGKYLKTKIFSKVIFLPKKVKSIYYKSVMHLGPPTSIQLLRVLCKWISLKNLFKG